jgi:hypothetical protein
VRRIVFALLVASASCGGKHDASASGSASGSRPGAAWLQRIAAGALPQACSAWKDAIARYAACTTAPADARAAIQHAFDATAARWASLGADDRAALGSSCESGLQGINAQLAEVRCP